MKILLFFLKINQECTQRGGGGFGLQVFNFRKIDLKFSQNLYLESTGFAGTMISNVYAIYFQLKSVIEISCWMMYSINKFGNEK